MRREQDIFGDLSRLCTSPGYAHAIAVLCLRDDFIMYHGILTSNDMEHLSRREHLNRAEMSTLIGLMIKDEVDYTLPDLPLLGEYIDTTVDLLEELHRCMESNRDAEVSRALTQIISAKPRQPISEETIHGLLSSGPVLREAMFYGAESAHHFQYRDLAPKRYKQDVEWLETDKGFTIETVRRVAEIVSQMQSEKATNMVVNMRENLSDERDFLPLFLLNVREVARLAEIDSATVQRIFIAFSSRPKDDNTNFQTLNDFNKITVAPFIRYDENSFILFQTNTLMQAMYESPFYWMHKDHAYRDTATRNRGKFTEEFCRERLEVVFGKDHVHQNVAITASKGRRLGEIDVLVLFADRAVIVQAKSKQLTLEARRGIERKIKDDFQKSVQESYDQGYKCAQYLAAGKYDLRDKMDRKITIPHHLKEMHILCVISDHYPALNSQAEHFLRYKSDTAPFVMDVFTLDVMTEMLESPLRLLSYIKRRTNYFRRVHASHELTILSDHIKNNLWVDNEQHLSIPTDQGAIELDSAMMVRRMGVPGKRTPDGVLTRFEHTPFGLILGKLEKSSDPESIALGLMLLSLGEGLINRINRQIKKLLDLVKKDGRERSTVIRMPEGGTGLIIYCGHKSIAEAVSKLRERCERYKYAEKANSWFGICLSPSDGVLRRIVSLDYKWEWNADMEADTRRYSSRGRPKNLDSTNRVGRNERCPCGSGLKYKKCCLP